MKTITGIVYVVDILRLICFSQPLQRAILEKISRTLYTNNTKKGQITNLICVFKRQNMCKRQKDINPELMIENGI